MHVHVHRGSYSLQASGEGVCLQGKVFVPSGVETASHAGHCRVN